MGKLGPGPVQDARVCPLYILLVCTSSPGVGRVIDQSGDAAEGSEIEVRSADHSALSAEKNFSPSFSVIRMGSRGTFVL